MDDGQLLLSDFYDNAQGNDDLWDEVARLYTILLKREFTMLLTQKDITKDIRPTRDFRCNNAYTRIAIIAEKGGINRIGDSL